MQRTLLIPRRLRDTRSCAPGRDDMLRGYRRTISRDGRGRCITGTCCVQRGIGGKAIHDAADAARKALRDILSGCGVGSTTAARETGIGVGRFQLRPVFDGERRQMRVGGEAQEPGDHHPRQAKCLIAVQSGLEPAARRLMVRCVPIDGVQQQVEIGEMHRRTTSAGAACAPARRPRATPPTAGPCWCRRVARPAARCPPGTPRSARPPVPPVRRESRYRHASPSALTGSVIFPACPYP